MAVTAQRAADAAACAGLAHPAYVDVAVRVRSFEGDSRYLAVPSRLPAAGLADAGLFLAPEGFGQDPRCFRCGILVPFKGLVVGQLAEHAHSVAVASQPGLKCSLVRDRVPPVRMRDYDGLASASPKKTRK